MGVPPTPRRQTQSISETQFLRRELSNFHPLYCRVLRSYSFDLPLQNDNERLLPFVTTYQPAVKNLEQILMEQRSLIQNQPLLKTIYKKPPIISYKRGKSLKLRHAYKSN